MDYIRLVPAAPLDWDTVDEFARRMGFAAQKPTDSISENEPNELTWISADGLTAIRLVYDSLIEVTYLAVCGAQTEAISNQIQASLDIENPAALRKLLTNSRDFHRTVDVLYRTAAAASSGYDADAFAVLCWGLFDPDVLARRVALVSISIVAWPEFLPLLDYIIKHDSELEVQSQAERVRDLIHESTVSSGPPGS